MSALICFWSIPIISTNQPPPDLFNSFSDITTFHSPKLSKLIYISTHIYWKSSLFLPHICYISQLPDQQFQLLSGMKLGINKLQKKKNKNKIYNIRSTNLVELPSPIFWRPYFFSILCYHSMYWKCWNYKTNIKALRKSFLTNSQLISQ